jgi:hypothetical protein
VPCRQGNERVTAAIRIVLLSLLPIIAAFSNLAHARPTAPAPIAKHHAAHGEAPVHREQQAPCCDMESCIGCAVPAVALAMPVRSDGVAFVDRPVRRAMSLVNHNAVPDPPPPRGQS